MASGERILGLGGKFLWLLDQLFPDHTRVISVPDKQREDIELISAPPTQIYIYNNKHNVIITQQDVHCPVHCVQTNQH